MSNHSIALAGCQGQRQKSRHLEIMLVILSAAKDLARRTQRSFPFAKRGASAHALRMTGRIARKSAHGKSYLQMSEFANPSLTGSSLSLYSNKVFTRFLGRF